MDTSRTFHAGPQPATVAALTALGRTDQLRSHLTLAIQNGLTRNELAEAATHLAFYAGWPAGISAATILKQVLHDIDKQPADNP